VRDSIGVGQPFGDFSRYFNMLERIKGNDKVDELIMHLVDGMEDDELPALAAAEARLVEALALADPADPLFRRRAHYLLHVVRHSRAVARAFYVVGREKTRDLYKGDWADYRDELRRCLAQIAPETRRAGPWFRQATRLEQWGSVRQTTKDPLANAAAFAAGIDVRRVTSPTER
jgi:hypothetical protein